jgi:YVTN family beta-propeller protein
MKAIPARRALLLRIPGIDSLAARARSAALLFAAAAALAAHAQTVTATVNTGSVPTAVAVNSVTNKVYVVSSAGNDVTVIDGVTNAATTVPVGTAPVAIDVNMTTNKVYVANGGSNSVTVIDGATNSISTVALPGQPTSIAVDAVTNKVYVSEDTFDGSVVFGCVTVIDGATNTPSNIDLGSYPGPIVVNPATDKIYFLNDSSSLVNVTQVDGASNATTLMGTDGDPVAIAVNPATNKVYVAGIKGSDITVINAATNTYSIVGSGFEFEAVAVNPVTNKIYVVNDDGNGTVTEIDGATNATTIIPTGLNPAGLAVNSVTNVIYVTNSDPTGSVTVIDGLTGTTSSVTTGTNPFAVALNPVTDKVYVLSNNAAGTVSVMDGVSANVAPAITSEPASQTVNLGAPVVFNVTANGRPLPSYQWSFNGAPLSDGNGISGSSTPTLFLGGVASAEAGAYSCTVTNSAGSATSTAADLAAVTASDPGRIINLSARAYVVSGGLGSSYDLTAGFVIGGQGSKTMLLRGVGPTLSTFGLQGALPILTLSLFDAAASPNLITGDMGWQNPPSTPAGPWAGRAVPVDATASDFSQVGAFALTGGSADCAVRVALPAGAYTSQISGNGTSYVDAGVALAELYDEDAGATGTHLINISARAFVADGGDVLIAGFVITGSTSQTLLVRASGPALAASFSLPTTLPDPQLQIYDSNQNLVASNVGWAGNSQIAAAAASVGAFPWTVPTSADSALLISLPPGNYTAEVSSLSGNGGQALVEVYVVP